MKAVLGGCHPPTGAVLSGPSRGSRQVRATPPIVILSPQAKNLVL